MTELDVTRETHMDSREELERLEELGDSDDEASLRERSDIMMAQSAKAGWLALQLAPEAKNYITVDLHVGDQDLARSVVQVEVRWRSGKTTAEAISELRREVEGLKANARDQEDRHRRELDDAIAVANTIGEQNALLNKRLAAVTPDSEETP